MQFRCPNCQAMLVAEPELSGQLVACPCSHQMYVPVESAAVPAPKPEPPPPVLVQCTCGKHMRVPPNSVGKAVRCPCGLLLKVLKPGETPPPSPIPSIAAPSAPAQENWLQELPPVVVPSNADSSEFYRTAIPELDYAPEEPRTDYPSSEGAKKVAKMYMDEAKRSQSGRYRKP